MYSYPTTATAAGNVVAVEIAGLSAAERATNFLAPVGQLAAKGSLPGLISNVNFWAVGSVDSEVLSEAAQYLPTSGNMGGFKPNAAMNSVVDLALNPLTDEVTTLSNDFKAESKKIATVTLISLAQDNNGWTEVYSLKLENVQVIAVAGKTSANVFLVPSEKTVVEMTIPNGTQQKVLRVYPAAAAA